MSSTCWWYPGSTVTPGLNPWAPDLHIYYLQYISMDVLQTPQNLTYLKQIHLFLTPSLTHTISSPNLHKSKTALISQPVWHTFLIVSNFTEPILQKKCFLFKLQNTSPIYNVFIPQLSLQFKFHYFLLGLWNIFFTAVSASVFVLLHSIPYETARVIVIKSI